MRHLPAILILSVFSPEVMAQSDWTRRNIPATESNLRSVAWGGGKWIAVGDAGAIISSSDGLSWTQQKPAAADNFHGVVRAGSRWVVVGAGSGIQTSADGTNWTQIEVAGSWRCVAWTGSLIVAGGWDGKIVTSPDGQSWTVREIDPRLRFLSITWTGNRIAALDMSGALMLSADGASWERKQLPGLGIARWNAIAWDGVKFGVAGDRDILTSPDGDTWRPVLAGDMRDFRALIWTGNQWIAGGMGSVYISSDGITWTRSHSGVSFNAVAAGAGSLVAVGNGGTILLSSNGKDWRLRSATTTLTSVTWTGSRLFAVGLSGAVLSSSDGMDWTIGQIGMPRDLFSVAASGNALIAVGDSGTVVTSEDGINWTPRNTGTNIPLRTVKRLGNLWVAAGFDSTVLTSPDGAVWTRQPSGTEGPFADIAWTGNRAIGVGYRGLIARSRNGTTWDSVSVSGLDHPSYNSVLWTPPSERQAQARLVAIGYHSGFERGARALILTSDGGASWVQREVDRSLVMLSGITWAGRQFVAVGRGEVFDDRTVATSPDGIHWTVGRTGFSHHLYSATWTGKLVVAVGGRGLILTATQIPTALAPASPAQPVRLQGTPGGLRLVLPEAFRAGGAEAALFTLEGRNLARIRIVGGVGEALFPHAGAAMGRYVVELRSADRRVLIPVGSSR